MENKLKVIGSYAISNNMSINIYDLTENGIKASYNNKKPRTYKIYHNEFKQDYYFNFGKIRIYLNEIMRV